jgi:hypothetical protein
MLSITPPIRDWCRQELIRLTTPEYGLSLESVLWNWSQGKSATPTLVQPSSSSSSSSSGLTSFFAPKKPPSSTKVSSGSKKDPLRKGTIAVEDVHVPVDTPIQYEGKFKQLLHNLQLNKNYLVSHFTPETLIFLDDALLATGTPFEHLRQETSKHKQRLEEILKSAPVANSSSSSSSFLSCRKCKSHNVHTSQKQTRSADEGMTVFVTCADCGTRWKMT